MQVFLPYANIIKSVQCLDNKRLGKQRVESYQILRILSGLSTAWKNHPAVKQWQGYETCLEWYMNECIKEWVKRGFKNTMLLSAIDYFAIKKSDFPEWLGNEQFHSSHRASLLAKDYEYYKQFNWSEEPKIDYFWPTKNGY